jgi:predicted ribosome quality control (RQC) complex YloA/Tae2 family protein
VHNNYYFLRQLSASLEKILMGCVISECFSQAKEELIIRLETHNGSFFIKGSVSPGLSCLSFPGDFQRARKNSVDLFGMLIGQRVTGIRQFTNERSFALTLSNAFSVLFKMHGNRSNIVVFENDAVSSLFRNNIEADHALKLSTLDREIDWSFENFERHQGNAASVYFTFGKVVWRHLAAQDFDSKTLTEKWEMLQAIRAQLESPVFYITDFDGKPVLSLLPVGKIKKTWNDPVAACNDFYYTFTQVFARDQQKNEVLSLLRSRLASSKNYHKKNTDKLQELTHDNNYRMWADLIMANLHAIKPGVSQVTVQNFYNENLPVDIRLKKELTPQKNAEVYYRKSKNQQVETDRLEQAIKAKEAEMLEIERRIAEVESAGDLKALKKIQAELQGEPEAKKQATPLPYHEFIVNGFRIWVGKNAQSNDVLTFKLGHKEDLWLHAKDVAGSHVLIKHQSGKNFPKDVIGRAAQLAAYNSKRKTESLCPVMVTPRKFVRKRKGDPAGAVVVEREEVVMAEPKLE